jgi:hypothetical protein
MFRALRIVLLLFVLGVVAGGAFLARERSTSWERSLRVVVFPIDADASPATGDYVRTLSRDTFRPISDFFREETQRYGLTVRDPVDVFVAAPVAALPPALPTGGNVAQVMLWSLQLRFWAWRHAVYDGPAPDVRVFVLYHDPERVTRVPHSLGLQKGLIGVVYAFASRAQAAQNNVVIAHELLHTLGATDKYDPRTNQPVHPAGYAEPERQPLLPQRFAEIMAGRIPLSADQAEMPAGLEQALVGEQTAREIRWISSP